MGCFQSKRLIKQANQPTTKKAGNYQPKVRSSLASSVSNFTDASNTITLHDIQAMHKVFLEKYPHGKISREQVQAFYKNKYPDKNSDVFVKEMFRIFDADGNGTIDYNEMVIAMSLLNKGPIREKLLVVFSIFDLDKSGNISIAEMHRFYEILQRIGQTNESVEERTKKLFSEMDLNHDGEISIKEFIFAVMKDASIIHPVIV